jgi:hypothetical protein
VTRALLPAAVLLAALAGCSHPPAKPPVPVISNIPQPNAACTPGDGNKVGLHDDLSQILFIGWIDGKQVEMLMSQVAPLALDGHKVEYAWFCPPRSKWH